MSSISLSSVTLPYPYSKLLEVLQDSHTLYPESTNRTEHNLEFLLSTYTRGKILQLVQQSGRGPVSGPVDHAYLFVTFYEDSFSYFVSY